MVKSLDRINIVQAHRHGYTGEDIRIIGEHNECYTHTDTMGAMPGARRVKPHPSTSAGDHGALGQKVTTCDAADKVNGLMHFIEPVRRL